jgi:autotransporter translocation and assembly factor TamB
VIVAGCLAISAAVTIRTVWFHQWLLQSLIHRSQGFLAGDLSASGLTGNVLEGVTLHDVMLRQDGDAVIAAPLVAVSYDWIGLVRGRFVLDTVDVSSPTIVIAERADGWNIARLLRQSADRPMTQPNPFVIQKFHVSDGRVIVRPLGGPEREARRLETTGSMSFEAGITRVSVAGLRAMDPASGLEVERFSMALRAGHGDWAFEDVRLETVASRLEGHARFTGQSAERAADLEVHAAALSLDEAGRLFPAIAGRLLTTRLDATAAGPFRALDVRWTSTAPDGETSGAVIADISRTDATGLRGTVTLSRVDPAPVLLRPDLSGRLTATANFTASVPSSSLSAATVSFKLSASDVALGAYSATGVRATGAYARSRLRASVVADAYGAHADVNVEWARPGATEFAVGGRLTRVNLPAIGRAFDVPSLTDRRLDGALNGVIDLHGHARSVRDAEVLGSASLEASTLGGIGLPKMRVDGQLSGGTLTADVDGAFGNLNLDALGTFAPIPTGANGDVRAHIVFADVTKAPQLETTDAAGTVTLGPSVVAGLQVDDGVVEGAIVKGLATVTRAELSGEDLTVHASGLVALAGSDSSDLDFEVQTQNLSRVGAAFGRPLSGRAFVNGKLTGAEGVVTAKGTASAQQFVYGDALTALTAQGTFTLSLPEWQLDRITGTVTGDGAFLTVEGVQVDRAAATLTYNTAGLDFDASLDAPRRSLQVAGRLTPGPERRELIVQRFSAGAGNVVWTLAPQQEAVVRYDAGQVTVEPLAVQRGTQRISIAGTLPVEGGGRYADGLNIRLEQVQAGDLNTLLLGEHKVTGVIDGTARVAGSLRNPSGTADVSVTKGSVDAVPFEAFRAEGTYADSRLVLDAHLRENAATELTAKGTVPLHGAPGMDVHVDGSAADVGLFEVLTTRVNRLHGSARAAVHVTGSTTAPLVTGTVSTQDVGFDVVATGVRYQHLATQLRFDADAVHIDQLSVTDDSGRAVTAQGGVEGWLAGGQRLDVRLTADGVRVLHNALGDVSVNGDVHVGGTLQQPEVTGTLRARSARLEADRWLERYGGNTGPEAEIPDPFAPPAPIAPVGGRREAPTPPRPGSLFDRTSLNLTIDLPDNVLVRGRDLVGLGPIGLGDVNLTVGGQVQYRKPAGQPLSLSGRVEVIRGLYYFQGRPFQVDAGSSITFRDPQPANPSLDVSANREVSGVLVNVAVRGSARRPRVALTSTPPLDEADILSLVVFNQPVNDLDVTERSTLADRATALAAGAVASPISDAVARALDLDLFDVRASDEGTGPVVSIGRQVGSFYVSAEQHFGDDTSSALSLEYRISKLLKVVSSVAQGVQQTMLSRWSQQTGVDLIFVVRY